MKTAARPHARFYTGTDDSDSAFQGLLDTIAAGYDVLELGCSGACESHRLAERGCTVTGVSPIPEDVEAARRAAVDAGLTNTTFGVMAGDDLDLADHSFDAVIASGVLHRLDVARAFAEMARVLRSDGQVILLEPLGHNPLINAYRRRTPHDRIRFEHPVRREDFSLAGRWFDHVDVQTHHLLSLAAAPAGSGAMGRAARGVLARIDRVLLAPASPLRWQAWIAVITLRDPR